TTFYSLCIGLHRDLHSFPTRRSSDLGMPLGEIRSALVRDLRSARSEMEALLAQTVELAEQVLDGDDEDIVVTGQNRLIGLQDLRSEEHTSELQSRENLVCRLLLEKKK